MLVPKLRPYQADLKAGIRAAWAAGHDDVLAVAATGSGKTVLFSDAILDEPAGSLATAHRQELVSQMALALARNGVRHRVIGSAELAATCREIQRLELGFSFVDPAARCAVASVDSLPGYVKKHPEFPATIRLVVMDEAHHVLVKNKWGKARSLFSQARALHVTATPGRPDGAGLGRHADGFIDVMIEAPPMREIINMGYLTDYRVVVADSDVQVSEDMIGPSGEFVQAKLIEAVHRSKTLVGDVVKEYQRHAAGKLGVTFAVDVASATEIAAAYRAAGVPAEVVHADTTAAHRADILRRFRRREVLQLVNVDLFGEGFDLPAIEVVSMARHTNSFILYAQQFGRALRLMIDKAYADHWDSYTDEERRRIIAASGKPRAIIIDHVGNLVRHNGPPDKPRVWSLDRRERRSNGPSDAIPYRVCASCASPFEKVYRVCPFCAAEVPLPAGRSTPAQVDGNMFLLSDEAMAALRGAYDQVHGAPAISPYMAPAIAGNVKRMHWERQQAIRALQDTAAIWRGWQHQQGHTDEGEVMSRFYFAFGIDWFTAQTLGRPDAEALQAKVAGYLTQKGIDTSVTLALP